MAQVSIIGNGYVGSSQMRLLSPHHNVLPWDPAAGQGGPANEARLHSCELAVVCVPTPMCEDGSCDTSIVESALAHLVSMNDRCLILVRSTVPPGTTDRLAASLGIGHRLHHSPEFVVERTGEDARDRMIVGGPRAAEVLQFFDRVLPAEARRVVTTRLQSEMVKYMTNAFLATRVAFSTEMADLCQTLDLSWTEMRELWLLDERIGRSHTMVFDGDRGFGGKCLPKDTAALRVLARYLEVPTPLLDGVMEYSQ